MEAWESASTVMFWDKRRGLLGAQSINCSPSHLMWGMEVVALGCAGVTLCGSMLEM